MNEIKEIFQLMAQEHMEEAVQRGIKYFQLKFSTDGMELVVPPKKVPYGRWRQLIDYIFIVLQECTINTLDHRFMLVPFLKRSGSLQRICL